MLPKAQASKAKINKGDYSKFKDFCTASEKKINKVKRKTKRWEKIFAFISDKRLISRLYKNHSSTTRK